MKFYHSGSEIDLTVEHLYVAGWTGRNADAVQHHIDELAEIGVAPPSEVPLYYRVSSSLLVHANTIEVLGPETSGEVEPLIIQSAGALWLGLASDHTDRGLEGGFSRGFKADLLKARGQGSLAIERGRFRLGHLNTALLNQRGWKLGQLSSGRSLEHLAAAKTDKRLWHG